MKHYGYQLKQSTFPVRLRQKNWERDILPAQNILMGPEYGFTLMEIKHIIKYKPGFVLFEEDYETSKTGIKALKEILCSDEK